MEILPIDNGHRDKLPKRRIMFLIGMFVFAFTFCRILAEGKKTKSWRTLRITDYSRKEQFPSVT